MTNRAAVATADGWHAALSVGNALLDSQHIELFAIVSTMTDLAASHDGAFVDAAHDLLALAARHFAAEEAQLARAGYEWLDQHADEHEASLDRLRSICARAARGDEPREAACAAVFAWLREHIEEMDLPAAEWMRPAAASRIADTVV